MKRLGGLIWVAVAAVLTSCSGYNALVQKLDDARYSNPHVNCAGCHGTAEPKKGMDLFPNSVDPASVCLTCHNYRENHHPFGFAPANPDGFPFPLTRGEVTCLTCHEIHGGTDHVGSQKLLRGGPYADRREVCFKCHEAERYADINPHDMFDKDGATRIVDGKPVCLLCHAVKPDPFQDRTADVRFKADIGFLCWRCHPPMPGQFLDLHFLVTPKQETLTNMLESEERLEIILPLVPRGRITCSTCHNPHQKGLLSFVDAAKGADAPAKLRMADMCDACHKM